MKTAFFFSPLISLTLLSFSSLLWFILASLPNMSIFFEWKLLSFGPNFLSFPMFFDTISVSFGAGVLIISSAVYMFSMSYMSSEKFFLRFHMLLILFVSSMLLLVFSPNLVSLLLGWDGLGVTSYLLVIYFNSSKSFNAGMITALTNRIGDCLILISLGLFLGNMSFNYFIWSPEYWSSFKENLFTVMLLFFLASLTKSAQIPFSAWLPAAMAAPTPVSSLVHSSTLVTAGVYIMIRLSNLFPETLTKYLMTLGLLTMTLAGLSALWETDMKKVVALSTLSQLGLMMISISMSSPWLALFHLLTHAFFKALLFMTVGNFIHLSSSNQDLRLISLPSKSMGASFSFSLIANLSLMGIPFLGGFYSKDLIIELLASKNWSSLILTLMIISVSVTAAYTTRLLMFIFSNPMKFNSVLWTTDWDHKMELGMLFLWPLAIGAGSVLSWTILPSPTLYILPSEFKFIILILIMVPIFWLTFNLTNFFFLSKMKFFWSLGSMWAIPFISSRTNLPFYVMSKKIYKNMDLSWNPIFISVPMIFFSNNNQFNSHSLFVKVEVMIFISVIGVILFLY